ncbi:MAG TPA: KEOPS complex N(6)-L-threonylcarbamoyladenine synthase Kae1 [Candidatus Pacearchaeota archaeon]|nr:KEOPS complex N(6)-L-threonylcarbamoyladenine synthase Kae1 [Candidatus Pacearchaeota archaeon]
MIIGIESTAHTFGVGIVDKGKILANEKDAYTTESGGIIPMDAAAHHKEVSEKIWKGALEVAGVEEDKIDAIAISQAPGLPPCLAEGMRFAKKKAKELDVPLVPINHCVAHLEIGKIVGAKDPVMLYASGANTQIIAYAEGKYRVFGETLDTGIGNFIDNFARYFDLGFPGGPKVEKLAKEGKYIEVPYTIKGMDVAFSGLLTKLKQLYEKGENKEDLAFSLQETAFATLVEAAERALAHTGKKELLLGGGVGCNARLQEMCKLMCEERGAKFFVPERSLLVDNGAMIAYLGEIIFNAGIKVEDVDNLDIDSRQRTDMVDVRWK